MPNIRERTVLGYQLDDIVSGKPYVEYQLLDGSELQDGEKILLREIRIFRDGNIEYTDRKRMCCVRHKVTCVNGWVMISIEREASDV